MPATSNIQTVDDARQLARRRLPRMVFNFVDGGAGSESGMRLNRSELEAIRLQPRVLVNVENRQLAKQFLGLDYQLPFGIAPMGMAGLAWAGADKSLARCAADAGIPVCVSTASSMSLEDYRHHAGEHAWFQLYFASSNQGTLDLARRASDAGYQNLIFTVDTPILSHRPRELGSGFRYPFTMGVQQFTDCALHPHWSLTMLADGIPGMKNFPPPSKTPSAKSGGFDRNVMRGAMDFEFLDQLRRLWPGKLIVKGVTSLPDAVGIRDHGADAIWISTHGGRQLDSAPAAISVLPAIRDALGPQFPLIFDSGVRNGDSIVKALALGASFVMMGRPFLYALAAAGEPGLRRIIDLLRDDVSRTIAQIGLTDINTLDASVIAPSDPRRTTSATK